MMMKLVTLLLAVFAVANAKPAFTATSAALKVRGGGDLGPIDSKMVKDLGQASLALYLGASAQKFVASQTGGKALEITDVLTNEIMTTYAFVALVATGAYFIADAPFGAEKTADCVLAAILVQKIMAGGGIDKIVDTIMDNKILTLTLLVSCYLHYA